MREWDWFKFGFVRGIVSLGATALAVFIMSLLSIPSTITIGYTAFGYSGGYSIATGEVYVGDLYGALYVVLWAFSVFITVCISSGGMYVLGADLAKYLNLDNFSDLKNAIVVGLLGAVIVTVIYIVGGYLTNALSDPVFSFVASVIIPFAVITEPLYTYVTWHAVRLFGIERPTL